MAFWIGILNFIIYKIRPSAKKMVAVVMKMFCPPAVVDLT